MEDSIQVHCTRCKNIFRDRARRMMNGYSRQCPSCEVVLFFDEDSHDPGIRRAMRTARQVLKELREREAAPARKSVTTSSRQPVGRSRSAPRGRGADDDE
jgi:predicted  nucleic acid-binding Zn-ribbon protein